MHSITVHNSLCITHHHKELFQSCQLFLNALFFCPDLQKGNIGHCFLRNLLRCVADHSDKILARFCT